MSADREAAIREFFAGVEDVEWLLAELAAARETCPFCLFKYETREVLARHLTDCSGRAGYLRAALDATGGQE